MPTLESEALRIKEVQQGQMLKQETYSDLLPVPAFPLSDERLGGLCLSAGFFYNSLFGPFFI